MDNFLVLIAFLVFRFEGKMELNVGCYTVVTLGSFWRHTKQLLLQFFSLQSQLLPEAKTDFKFGNGNFFPSLYLLSFLKQRQTSFFCFYSNCEW